MPRITLLFVSLHALLLMLLVVPIVLHRRRHGIGVGDGGDVLLARRMRVQANFVEYVPLALLLLALLELSGLPSLWLWLFGGVLFVGRCLHAYGFSRSPGGSVGRVVGTVMTWADLVLMACAGLVLSLSWLLV